MAYGVNVIDLFSREPDTEIDYLGHPLTASTVGFMLTGLLPADVAKLPGRGDRERVRWTEAERRASTRLDVLPGQVVIAARTLWGRSLDEERDARVDKMPDAGDARALRGHVTRQLTQELGMHLEKGAAK